MQEDMPIQYKELLSVEEASLLFNIGINKMKEISKDPKREFTIWIGRGKKLIKRRKFIEYINSQVEI